MAVTAKLKIQLFANDVLVAESEDDALWQKVLAAMHGGGATELEEEEEGTQDGVVTAVRKRTRSPKGNGGVEGFADQLGVESDVLVGACGPSTEAPYIHLDAHFWEALKQNTPPRGAKAVAAINLAGTLLCLWFKHAGIEGRPTQTQAKAVLATVGVQENNPTRSLGNCEWLQSRGGGIQINPAKQSKAVAVARAYCAQTPVEQP